MNIGLATLPRDRFGSPSLINPSGPGQFLTCPLEVGARPGSLLMPVSLPARP